MELFWPLAVAGAFALFAHTAQQSIRRIPVSCPMPRSLQAFLAGCTAVVIGLLLEVLALSTAWHYALLFCMLICDIMVSEYAWARRYRCAQPGPGGVSR